MESTTLPAAGEHDAAPPPGLQLGEPVRLYCTEARPLPSPAVPPAAVPATVVPVTNRVGWLMRGRTTGTARPDGPAHVHLHVVRGRTGCAHSALTVRIRAGQTGCVLMPNQQVGR